jgi:hypothetical protein
MEHLTLERHGRRITATGVMTAATPALSCGAWYQIFLDERWRPKAVSVHLTDSRWFVASSPEPGQWCDGDGRPLEDFAGCRDVVLPESAFWCTPVLRRMALAGGESKAAKIMAIDLAEAVPELMSLKMAIDREQRTVSLKMPPSVCGPAVEFDHDGLADHYPERFRRLD